MTDKRDTSATSVSDMRLAERPVASNGMDEATAPFVCDCGTVDCAKAALEADVPVALGPGQFHLAAKGDRP